MKKKFELKCNKIKGISFHQTRQNWIAIGLFTGEIQIWDFRNGFKIAEFKDTDVCIRSIDFHPIQCLIVSGGDDFVIRGYDYSENKKSFELKGHVDFVRTVQFHNELPWVLSSSDDQTLRIWNWQSKTQLSVITGHSHYVMCARFHPSKDLIASGSLDSNLRIWDYSKLKSRFSSSHGSVYMLSNDVEATVVVETHAKGINWIEFHPTEDLVATCSDDKLIKLWKFTPSGAYEETSFHGHNSNVSSISFSPDGKHLVSNSEDFYIRYWDLKSGVCVQKYLVPEERQWTVAFHPQLPLVASGGDKSLVILSMNSEKIQFDTTKYGVLVYFSPKDFILKSFILSTGFTMPLNVSGNRGRANENPEKKNATSLSLNPFSQGVSVSGSINLTISGDSVCHIFNGTINEAVSMTAIKARQAVFLSNEKILTLGDDKRLRLIKLQGLALLNDFEIPYEIDGIFQANIGKVFIKSGSKIVSYDLLAKREIFVLEDEEFQFLRKIQWSMNKTYFSVITKFSIFVFDKKGKKKCSKKEESKIKSIVWGPDNVLFYNTHEHIKFILKDGEIGLVRSINKIMFLSFYLNRKLIAFDVNEKFEEIELDMTEIEFKNAFLKKTNENIQDILKDKTFLGKSMVSYLLNKKFNSVALQLTTDKETAFYLAFYSKNFMKAFDLAQQLGQSRFFDMLGNECMNFGVDELAEKCFKLSNNKQKLISLYGLTGDFEKMQAIEFEDKTSNFNKTLLSGNIEERIKLLSESGQIYLAYSTAVTHGFDEYARRFEKSDPGIKNKIKLPIDSMISPNLKSLGRTVRSNSKILAQTVDSDDVRVAIEELSEEEQDDGVMVQLVNLGSQQTIENKPGLIKTEGGIQKNESLNILKAGAQIASPAHEIDIEEVGNAWGLEDNELLDQLGEQAPEMAVENPQLQKRTDIFFEEEDFLISKIRKLSSSAFDLFSIGELEIGIKLLKQQIGLQSHAPLKRYITEFMIYNKFYSFANVCGETVSKHHFMKTNDQTYNRYTFEVLKKKFDNILGFVTKAKLIEAVEAIKSANLITLIVRPEFLAEAEGVSYIKSKMLHYSVALRAKLQFDKSTDLKRKIELSFVMSSCSLDPVHRLLILQIALNYLVKVENYLHALILVRKYLKLCQDNPGIAKEENFQKMKKLESLCEQKGKNQQEFSYKEKYLYEDSIIDRIDFETLQFYFPENFNESHIVRCLFDRSSYGLPKKGSLCSYCDMCQIGYDAVQYSVVENFKRLMNK